MSKTRVSPLNTIEIRNYAMRIRRLTGYKDSEFINAPKLFDALSILLAEQNLNFDYRIMPDKHKIFSDKEEAYTDISNGIIYIKESVMEQACRRRYCRGSFTLIHELGHYLLHYLQEDTRLTRVSDDIDVPPYCDPERQADTFASEFLMPYEQCKHMEPNEIKKMYHVSKKAAEVRYEKIKKKKEIKR